MQQRENITWNHDHVIDGSHLHGHAGQMVPGRFKHSGKLQAGLQAVPSTWTRSTKMPWSVRAYSFLTGLALCPILTGMPFSTSRGLQELPVSTPALPQVPLADVFNHKASVVGDEYAVIEEEQSDSSSEEEEVEIVEV
eukprot:scaffold75686_cov15-Tisochrysis_lutea.AAC.6